jgi:hypothetical protein
METLEFNVVLNCLKKKIKIEFDSTKDNVENLLKNKIIEEFEIKKSIDELVVLTTSPTTKLLTNEIVIASNKKYFEVNVLIKQRGGLGIAMFGILVIPLIFIGTAFARGGNIIEDFLEIMVYTLEIIPTIFDPPKLIDDILYAITHSITTIFGKLTEDVKNSISSPEDDEAETGPFGVSNENRNAYKCLDPSWSTILLLIICPPLAIMYKLGFWAGFISSIICGVLCVKLYYFPGLLFAILHVLC